MNWTEFINNEKRKLYFKELELFLDEELSKSEIFPKREDWYNAYYLTPLEEVKVVIIGQDPYHNINQAHGLAFSVLNDKIPPSLRNIYKELSDDLNIEIPESGNLTKWAKQGVLLINAILTVRAHEPLSHKDKGWEVFTNNSIELLNNINKPIVFILWGNNARKYKKHLNNKKHLIIESAHPSPLSARRGFFKSKPFSKANKFLIDNQVLPIDWSNN